jgi:hypothetical protein
VFILAAALIVAGVALFVAAPLGIGLVGARAKSAGQLLRELEFDREMGKLSDADYDSMHKALEDRALTAMAAIEKIRDQAANAKKPIVTPLTPRKLAPAPRRIDPIPTLVVHMDPPRPQPPPPTLSASHKITFCPQCGMRAAPDSKFCAQCGIAIKPIGGAAAWTK